MPRRILTFEFRKVSNFSQGVPSSLHTNSVENVLMNLDTHKTDKVELDQINHYI